MATSALSLSQAIASWKDDYITLLCILLACLWYYSCRPRLHRPPGPWRWPLVGNLPQLMMTKNSKLPHVAMQELACRYGPMMTLQLGSLSCVVLSSGEWAKKFMKEHDQQFAHKGNMIIGESFYRNYQSIGIGPYNETSVLLKKICIEELLSPNRVKRNQHLRTDVMLTMVRRVLTEGEGGKSVSIDHALVDTFFTYTSMILFRSSYLGSKVVSGNKEKTLQEVVKESTSLGTTSIGELFPSLRRFDIGGVEAAYLRLRTDFDQFLAPIIEQHRKIRAQGEVDAKSRDFVDALLEHAELTDDMRKNVLTDMILGGIDTGAITTSWILAELMRHPDVRRRLQAELDEAVGQDRMVEEADLVNLPYLQAVVKETLRLHPAGAITYRQSDPTRTVQCEGYDIPKNTRIIINLYAISHDPQIWEDPLTFNPDRFLSSYIDVKGFNFELLPFGAGRRKCPGMTSGLLTVSLMMAHLLHACDFSLPEGMSPEDVNVEEAHGLTVHRRDPVHVRITHRLQPSVYTLDSNI
ncbi:hypothetical protein Mapa_014433 [Marchantia paleacea]|nr:hypothetical protein Mapa_014433 [Marchantia paleacea]